MENNSSQTKFSLLFNMVRKYIYSIIHFFILSTRKYLSTCYGSYTELNIVGRWKTTYLVLRSSRQYNVTWPMLYIEGKRGCWGVGAGEQCLPSKSNIYAGIRGFKGWVRVSQGTPFKMVRVACEGIVNLVNCK